MLFSTYYSRNYAGIIDACLVAGRNVACVGESTARIVSVAGNN